jgi:hypothetical protein
MKRFADRAGWAIAGALALALVMSLASVARGGSLDPTAPPGSTMRTLEELQPAWNKELSATGGCTSDRFDCIFFSGSPLFTDLAVHDRETGLVWVRNPHEAFDTAWKDAVTACQDLNLGGHFGWRLPAVEELSSLISGAGLPDGHPFIGPFGSYYWTSTTTAGLPGYAKLVGPDFGGVSSTTIDVTHGYWCVRGGGQSTTGGF